MRTVIYTDKRGYRHRALVRDNDSDDMAVYGIPQEPPDVEDIDWEFLKREIHNAMVDNGLITWDDVQKSTVGLSAVVTVVKRAMSGLYRQEVRALRKDKEVHN